jgi:hypothetical protein
VADKKDLEQGKGRTVPKEVNDSSDKPDAEVPLDEPSSADDALPSTTKMRH